MAGETKFGLVVGLGLVVAVAVTYFARDGAARGGGAASVVPSLPSGYAGGRR